MRKFYEPMIGNETSYEHHEEKSGYVGVLCPECYDYDIFKLDYSIHLAHTNKKYVNRVLHMDLNIVYECSHCRHIVTAEAIVDPNIAPILSILNQKGYYTQWSCEGHKEGPMIVPKKYEYGNLSVAYITFNGRDRKAILDDHPLPKDWYVDQDYDEEVNGIIDTWIIRHRCVYPYDGDIENTDSKVVEYIKEWEKLNPIKDRMKSIEEWAKSLPNWWEYKEAKYGD